MSRRLRLLALPLVALVGCTSAVDSASGTSAPAVTTARPAATSSSTTSTTSTTTLPPTTLPPATLPPTTSTIAGAPDFIGEEIIGTSVEGRPIVASHRGTPGGTVILVVGVIHGDENDGLGILDQLATMPLPAGIDLWLMPAMNPDGLANDVRGNGNNVDLNRNFPHDWTAIGQPGEWQYSGSGPASEPETKAFIDFTSGIQPALTLWYHQDLYRISPSNRSDGPLRKRYAELTGLPYEAVTGGIYTGVAATWVRLTIPDAMSFIIELGPTLSAEEAVVHANAVLAIAQMV
jgi:protein MpaA